MRVLVLETFDYEHDQGPRAQSLLVLFPRHSGVPAAGSPAIVVETPGVRVMAENG